MWAPVNLSNYIPVTEGCKLSFGLLKCQQGGQDAGSGGARSTCMGSAEGSSSCFGCCAAASAATALLATAATLGDVGVSAAATAAAAAPLAASEASAAASAAVRAAAAPTSATVPPASGFPAAAGVSRAATASGVFSGIFPVTMNSLCFSNSASTSSSERCSRSDTRHNCRVPPPSIWLSSDTLISVQGSCGFHWKSTTGARCPAWVSISSGGSCTRARLASGPVSRLRFWSRSQMCTSLSSPLDAKPPARWGHHSTCMTASVCTAKVCSAVARLPPSVR
mmetsp:Transcript_6765/g.19509  ORF Transcript_6765/g.19509 Transcript_6765/m.19509 type:complete len:280 (+) Transcript_6765:168-1007(+)